MKSNTHVIVSTMILLITIMVSTNGAMAATLQPLDPSGPESSLIQGKMLLLPLSFIENCGQAPEEVKFHVDAASHMISFMPDRIVLTAPGNAGSPPTDSVVSMEFVDSSGPTAIIGYEILPGTANFFTGSDPANWHNNIPTYAAIRYESLYQGIDLKYSGTDGFLKREFIVSPGSDPASILIAIDGINSLEYVDDGSIRIDTPIGILIDEAPIAYQEINGNNVPVEVHYRLQDGHTVGFEVGQYDGQYPLVIDPVLLFSSFLGGARNEQGNSIAIDSADNAYVTGFTQSTNFPVVLPAINGTKPDGSISKKDIFVTKVDTINYVKLYSTYIGGSGNDAGNGIAVDSSGAAYLIGDTTSTNFPLVNPIKATLNGTQDVFALKINSSGTSIDYSTYYGGSATDSGKSIAVDSEGNAYIAGDTASSDLSLVSPIQGTFGGVNDAFLAKINPDGTALLYSTYLGGELVDFASSIALDSSDCVYLAGETRSAGFPTTTGAYQETQGGMSYSGIYVDAFITKVNSTGLTLDYSTYLGRCDMETGRGIAVDGEGNAYVTGAIAMVNAGDFPLVNPIQPTSASSMSAEAFVTKINPEGSTLVYSTYLGGSLNDEAYAIALDSSNNAYIGGYTASTNFPTVAPLQPYNGGGTNQDAFITKVNSEGSAWIYSTYIGGSSTEWLYGIAAEPSGNVFITGSSKTGYPLKNQFQEFGGGAYNDAFISVISPLLPPVSNFTSDYTPGKAPLTVNFNDTSTGETITGYQWILGDDPATIFTDQNLTHTFTTSGYFSVNHSVTNAAGTSWKNETAYIFVIPEAPVADFIADITSGDVPFTVNFTDNSTGDLITGYQWIVGDDPATIFTDRNLTHTFTAPGIYSVNHSVTNGGGISWKNETDLITVTLAPPVSNFTSDLTSGDVPLAVNFTDNSIGELITGYEWIFGDDPATVYTDRNLTHVFSAAGIYSVNHSVTNDAGISWKNETGYVTATLQPPVAGFSSDVTTGAIPLNVQFNDASTGDAISDYQWIFGDNTATVFTDKNLTHTFTTPGYFSVNHSAANSGGISWKNETNYIRATGPLPANRHVFIYVSNDAGVKYDLDGSTYGSGNNNTYYVKFDGAGLNEVRMTNNPAQPGGQVTNTTTTSPDSSGTFYITNRGEAGTTDNLVLLLAVNGTIPEDFSAGIRSSGYSWTPNSTIDGQATDYAYIDGMIDETFTATDFLYGPQNWKPASTTGYPLFFGQNMGDGQTYSLMFIDLNVGALNSTLYPGLTDDGAAKVEYTLHNMTARAAFNAYGWRLAANQGQGISWTNRVSGAGSNGYSVLYAPLAPAPTVSSITPNTGPNTTTVKITSLSGSNFLLNPFVTQTVKLNGTGHADIVATNVTRISSTELNCTFNLTGQPAGVRNVVVTNPDGQSGMLENGFTITSPVAARHQAVFRHTMGSNWIFTDNLTGPKYRDHYGLHTDIPLVADFNNDGVADRAAYRNGTWIVDYNMDVTVDSRTPFGMATDVPIAGDFNNDGVTDRVVFRSGSWIVDHGMDGTVDSRTNFGMAGDIPLAGDFNNDGVTDRAVIRNGQWIVDYGMDGTVDSRTFFGLATDIPTVGYFDDNTIMDRAVFRNGEWIIDYGFDGSINLRPRFGAAGDTPLAWTSI